MIRKFSDAIIAGIKRALYRAGTTIDFYGGGILIAAGLFFLRPHLVKIRYPRMARDMADVMPIHVWGVIVLILGACVLIAAIWRAERVLVFLHILAFSFWLMIGYIFAVGAMLPTLEGMTAPITAALLIARVMQLPEGRCG